MPQALFRGPIEGVSSWLMPVAHGLEHAREEHRYPPDSSSDPSGR